jgi:hypothetical protein
MSIDPLDVERIEEEKDFLSPEELRQIIYRRDKCMLQEYVEFGKNVQIDVESEQIRLIEINKPSPNNLRTLIDTSACAK